MNVNLKEIPLELIINFRESIEEYLTNHRNISKWIDLEGINPKSQYVIVAGCRNGDKATKNSQATYAREWVQNATIKELLEVVSWGSINNKL